MSSNFRKFVIATFYQNKQTQVAIASNKICLAIKDVFVCLNPLALDIIIRFHVFAAQRPLGLFLT